ncbi:hypothetical protein ACLOJK_022078 [Asimina triloba]
MSFCRQVEVEYIFFFFFCARRCGGPRTARWESTMAAVERRAVKLTGSRLAVISPPLWTAILAVSEVKNPSRSVALANFSQFPTPPPRFRAPPKTRESLVPETVDGTPTGLKSRPRSTLPESNGIQKARRSLGVNKMKSGEDLGGQRVGEVEETKVMGRPGSGPVEQYSRLGRRVDPSSWRIEVGQDVKLKELQERLDESQNSVKQLQLEISLLKEQLEKMQNSNGELQSQNQQYAENLAAAEAKILSLENNKKRDSAAEQFQRPNFKDVQKLISNKLEQNMVKKENNVEKASTKKSAVPDQVSRNSEIHTKVINSPPPPPPPLPPRHAPAKAASMRKAPSLVEFYNSLAKREGMKDPPGIAKSSKPAAVSPHSSIVGEIQNRSAHLLAIKADIETKGDFIKFLIEKVQSAAYTDIEDVVTFIDWLDGELSSLADERAVLKHFNWPERKADLMREAATEYRQLKCLQTEISSYEDGSSMPCEAALKKMTSVLDKSERSIQRLIKLRDTAITSYRECRLPTEWMLDSGMVNKIKLATLRLAKLYLKRVMKELESVQHAERESTQETLMCQCVRFAYRAHQFLGGLDSEAMRAFEDIRQRVLILGGSSQGSFVGIASS